MLKVFFLIIFSFSVQANTPQDVFSTCESIGISIDCRLVTAIASVESSYRPLAYNPEGSYGVMQVQCPTAQYMGFEGECESLFNMRTNIKYGILYLNYLTKKHSSILDIIASYNAGKPIICKDINDGLCWPGQYYNQNYINKVLTSYIELNNLRELNYELRFIQALQDVY